MALNALRSSWSRPFPQHPRAAGGGGGRRRWQCCHRACRRRGGEQWTTVRTTCARTRQRVAPAAAAPAAASVAAAAAAAAWLPCYFLTPHRRPPRRWRPLLTLLWVRQKPLAAITYPPSDEDKALVVEERAGGRYPPVGGYPPDGSGFRSCGPRWTPRRRWAERPLRQQAVVTSATTTTAAMAAFLVSFFLISRSYVRSQAAPVGRRCSTCLCIFRRVKTVLSLCRSRVLSRTRFQYAFVRSEVHVFETLTGAGRRPCTVSVGGSCPSADRPCAACQATCRFLSLPPSRAPRSTRGTPERGG